MPEKATIEKDELLRLLKKLKDNTYELRSSITAILLYLESMDTMVQDQKESSIRICEQINLKNNELIYAESLFEKVLESFLDDHHRAALADKPV